MYFVTAIRLLAVLFAWYGGKGKLKNGLPLAFILLGVVAAIHYNYGSDYMEYYAHYEALTAHKFSLNILTSDLFRHEIGWRIISFVFKPIGGFFSLVAFISIVENYIYYDFIKRYVERKWWGIAVFIYTFSVNYYLLNMSMLRQGFAIVLFIWAVNLAIEKKLATSILVAITASSIHASAITLIPFVVVANYNKFTINNKYVPLLMFVILLILITNADLAQILFIQVEHMSSLETYTDSYSGQDSEINYGIAFVIRFVYFTLFLLYMYNVKENIVEKTLVFFAILEMIIFPISGVIRLSARMGYYFGAFLIPAFPIVMGWIPKKYIIVVKGCELLLIILLLYGNWTFFNHPDFGFSYMKYDTIFTVLFEN